MTAGRATTIQVDHRNSSKLGSLLALSQNIPKNLTVLTKTLNKFNFKSRNQSTCNFKRSIPADFSIKSVACQRLLQVKINLFKSHLDILISIFNLVITWPVLAPPPRSQLRTQACDWSINLATWHCPPCIMRGWSLVTGISLYDLMNKCIPLIYFSSTTFI